MPIEIALALGGGGVRGIAHLGVMRFLENEGFKIKAIAGTSIGGLIGALYAAGITIAQLEEAAHTIDQRRLFRRKRSDAPSLLGLRGVEDVLQIALGSQSFKQLKIPFGCTSVNLHSGQEIILTQGIVLDAVMATIAFPGIFPPRVINGITLVDGGVLDPVPVALARWLAPTLPIVAVCLSPEPKEWAELPAPGLPNILPVPEIFIKQLRKGSKTIQAVEIFARSMDILDRTVSELRLKIDKPDVLIRPNVAKFGLLDRVDPQELSEAGRIVAEQALPQIREALSIRHKISRYLHQDTSLPGEPLVLDDIPDETRDPV